jgi:hypothetical protein
MRKLNFERLFDRNTIHQHLRCLPGDPFDSRLRRRIVSRLIGVVGCGGIHDC